MTDAGDPFARFQILTTIMDSKRGEDGRVDANELQEALLKMDAKAFEKEGVDQLRQYLMKAREGGVPIKFDGDRSGLHQVWFKGHKDLVRFTFLHANGAISLSNPLFIFFIDNLQEVAIARYSQPGQNRRPPATSLPCTSKSSANDWSWRNRLSNQHQQQQGYQHHRQQSMTIDTIPDRTTTAMPSRYRTPSERAFDVEYLLELLQSSGANAEQGVDAKYIETKLLEVAQSLYEVRPDVKRFSHYLMNMRAAGAPIW